MLAYLSIIDLRGSVFSQSIFYNVIFHVGSTSEILRIPSQSQRCGFLSDRDFILVFGLFIIHFHSKYNLSWLLGWLIFNFLNCSCFSLSYSTTPKLSRDQNLTAIIVRVNHFVAARFYHRVYCHVWTPTKKSPSYSRVLVISHLWMTWLYTSNLGDFV